MSNTETLVDVIQWINETFVPMGLKPIEDLPKAVPGEGYSCVIAKVLRTNPNWSRASVFSSQINLELDDGYKNMSPDETAELIPTAQIILPSEIVVFLNQFDKGEYPELMDIEAIEDELPNTPYKDELRDNYYNWLKTQQKKQIIQGDM